MVRKDGFVNYFGMQRFGNQPVPTWEIGHAILQKDYYRAAGLILMPRKNDSKEAQAAREILIEEGDIDKAIKALPRYMHVERALLHALNELGTHQPLSALLRIPRNMRLMYVHSFQSYIWNHMASYRLRHFDAQKPVEGDVVYEKDPEKDPEANREDRELPPVKILTAADVDNYTIFDVVLPTPGTDVVLPEHLKGEYLRIMEAMNVDLMNTRKHNFPEAVVTGMYRKLLCRPADMVSELVHYDHPTQDLSDAESKFTRGNSTTQTSQDSAESKTAEHSDQFVAVKIRFTLPTSSYATVALRELMKAGEDERL